KVLETIFEDEHILIINKPEEFLSVPGKTITDSVYYRIRKKYPKATGPLVVHRLDMSTSGLMVIAKSLEVHKLVQRQFIKRLIKKKYIAVLDGELTETSGTIDLPLRVDIEDRPRQLVCYEHGKSARTEWQVIKIENGKTRIQFTPITGRTHQLRVHAAHYQGLACPILGDDLYGNKANRLHLHAAFIQFEHPVSKEQVTFEVDPNF
ncbi:MAG: tRNA pseudouridine32 synthase/23S rRNA pseudouridine746 synthase, partial [Flavobacteriales bacterium]